MNILGTQRLFDRVRDEDFALWAFGDVWNKYMVHEADSIDLMKSWNCVHGKLLELQPNNCVLEDMAKMKQLWEQHVKSSEIKTCNISNKPE